MTLLNCFIIKFCYMKRSVELRPNSNSYKVSGSFIINKNSSNIRESSNESRHE